MRYFGTYLTRLNKKRLFLPNRLVGEIIANSSLDKNSQKYIYAFGEQFKMEGISLPFVLCPDKDSEYRSHPLKFLDRLYVHNNSLIIPESVSSFLELTDKAVLLGNDDHFELWNPEHPEKAFSSLEAQSALPENKKVIRKMEYILNHG